MFVHTNNTVGTTATLILTLPKAAGYTQVDIMNRDNQHIAVGDSDITALSGANGGSQVDAGHSIQLWLSGGSKLYAISAGGTGTGAVAVMYSYIPKDYPTD